MTEPPQQDEQSVPAPADERATAPAHRLDPDRAAALAGAPAKPLPEPVIDTRPYRWMIGIFGLVLVVAISVYQFASNGVGTTGVPAGKPLHFFAAPLAASTLNGDANLSPPCTLGRHDPRALNICLLVKRAPLVLGLFATGSDDCRHQIDTMQAVSRQFSPSVVQFAAVARRGGIVADRLIGNHWLTSVALAARVRTLLGG